MSQAVRQFLQMLEVVDQNQIVTEAWDRLTPSEREEADELATCTPTAEMDSLIGSEA